MTSSGRLLTAHVRACLAIMISVSAAAHIAWPARAESVFGSSYPSARIYALGRDFAGVIPDALTDLALNPARAYETGSLTFDYGYRSGGGQSLPFPLAGGGLDLEFISLTNPNTNAIRVLGLKALGLRWAVDTEWTVHHGDECDQGGGVPIERDYSGNLDIVPRESCTLSDNNFLRLDIACAGKAGGGMTIGLRAGGTYGCYDYRSRYRSIRDEYNFDPDSGEYIHYRDYSSDQLASRTRKLYTGYIQAGAAWDDSGELAVRGGYARGNSLTDEYNLMIDSRYDRYSQEIDAYSYRLSEFREDRQGDTWQFSAFARKSYQGGIVIVTAGGYERGSYDSDWRDTYTQYEWGSFDELQINDISWYPGEGLRSRSEAVFRMGKTFAIEPRLDMTTGAHVNYWRERFDENGEAGIDSYVREDGNTVSYEARFPLSFERTDSRTELVLPLAIEFRPVSFFSLYSGFGMTFTWNRSAQRNTFLLDYGQGDDPLIPEEVETENNHFDSNYYASLGFSLRYREKLFLDMYTGSVIVPTSITNYFIDLRYVF